MEFENSSGLHTYLRFCNCNMNLIFHIDVSNINIYLLVSILFNHASKWPFREEFFHMCFLRLAHGSNKGTEGYDSP